MIQLKVNNTLAFIQVVMIESVVFIIASALIRIQLFDMLMNPILDGNYIVWGIHTEVQLNLLSLMPSIH